MRPTSARLGLKTTICEKCVLGPFRAATRKTLTPGRGVTRYRGLHMVSAQGKPCAQPATRTQSLCLNLLFNVVVQTSLRYIDPKPEAASAPESDTAASKPALAPPVARRHRLQVAPRRHRPCTLQECFLFADVSEEWPPFTIMLSSRRLIMFALAMCGRFRMCKIFGV